MVEGREAAAGNARRRSAARFSFCGSPRPARRVGDNVIRIIILIIIIILIVRIMILIIMIVIISDNDSK